MKYIILCGGIGKRNNHYSLPKPLNYINGKHLIEYIIESINNNEIYIIYNIILDNYNFKEIIINKFKNIIFNFASIDFLTRGPVETALIGVNNFNISNDENILFIDNDNLHELPIFEKYKNNFIGYSLNLDKENYSFIAIKNDIVINIEEKKKISDNYCCGLYGFINVDVFKNLSKQLIESNTKTQNEFYFSQLYKLIINNKEDIIPIYIKNTFHVGTYNEIILNQHLISKKKLRICFDLDNTLVSYPTIAGDYSTVKPITKNINLLNNLKNEGHEIIIYTARRMATHKSNMGKTIKDIGLVTFKNLEKFNIQYDELIFGKPIADIYIDDRCFNPYYNDSSLFGLFNNNDEYIQNKIDNNKYNTIIKKNDDIYKKGPYLFMKGELYFYQNIPSLFLNYFPKLLDFNKLDNIIELKLEYINGIPLYYLYKSNTLTTSIIDNLFEILDKFHSYDNIILNINQENIKNNYIEKLKNRFNKNDYYFEDAEYVFNNIIENLENNFNPKISKFIHGDLWFSNILMTYNDELKFIDMKGQVDNILTVCGDIYYDYGKLYQSILGYDLILHKDKINQKYIDNFDKYFIYKCEERDLNINYLKIITKSLIFGTFHSLKVDDSKQDIWNF